MNTFNELGLPDSITQSLTRMGLVKPTEIQAQTIPLALEGNDILGSAQTGTGKTMAFTLPLVNHLLNNPNATALVLAPIREIAQQVMNALKSLVGDSRDFNTALIIGGEPYPKQLMQLKSRPRVVIGTPGRIIDHLERGTLRVDNLECLVLDETDRMFDMGFGIQLDHIISKLPTKRQTMMFSATIPPAIEKLAGKYLNEPKRVAVGSATLPIPKIKQEIVNISEKDKYKRLLQEIEQRDGTIIVFVKTKMNADRLAEALRKEDHSASAIHGDLRQHQREKVIRSFRLGKCRVMVATDIAARGLDIDSISHVVNFDLPRTADTYLHRIGRTGRAGHSGIAISLVEAHDHSLLGKISRYLNTIIRPRIINELRPTNKAFGAKISGKPSKKILAKRKEAREKNKEKPKVKVRHRDSKNIGKRRQPKKHTEKDHTLTDTEKQKPDATRASLPR